jgi:hypothetical protein
MNAMAQATEVLLFKAGDPVIYRNDYGVEFLRRVTGYYQPEGDCPLYARGYRYLLDRDAYWMPVKEENLRIDGAQFQEDLIIQYGPTMKPFAA